MKSIIVFYQTDGDAIFELEFDYNFNIGDLVYYVLPQNIKDEIKHFYSNSDIEGFVVSRWIDLTEKVIKWQVNVDFVSCYDADA